MNRIISWALVLSATIVLSSCGPTKEAAAEDGLAQRRANAGHFRVVNLTGKPLFGKINGQDHGPVPNGRGTVWLKSGGGKDNKFNLAAPPLKVLDFEDKLPNKAVRTYYAVALSGVLKTLTIDNDPKLPGQSGPMIRGVNLTNEKVTFSASVNGDTTDLGEAGSLAGCANSVEISTGNVVGTAMVGGKKLTTDTFNGTTDHSFSVVVYKDAAGRTAIALVINHEKSAMAGQGSSAAG